MTLKFFKCSQCGSVAVKVYDAETPESPCAETQAELVPNTVDAAVDHTINDIVAGATDADNFNINYLICVNFGHD